MAKLVARAGGDRYIEVWYGARRLCRYNLRPFMTNLQGPRPYFHPVGTLQGGIVTQEKHFDHEWHNGLSLACPWVSGYNFWGGPTYVRDKGYRQLDNLGRQVHQSLSPRAAPAGSLRWRQTVSWQIPDPPECEFLQDERDLTVGGVDEAAGLWHIDFAFALTNPGRRDVVFGSPTTEGRPNAGYGGVFWRGPLDLLHGTILTGDGRSGSDLMGVSAPWLAYAGVSRATGAEMTVVLLDHPQNTRFPLKWFVRTTPFPVASYAFCFDEYLTLPPRAVLQRQQRIVVCDGLRSHTDIDRLYAAWTDASGSSV